MTYALTASIVLIVVLLSALVISIARNLQYAEKLEVLGDQIEESLDILDDAYQRIAKVAEMPVMSDEPIIQQLLQDIKHAKHAVLLVANKVVVFDREDDDE